MSWYLSQSVGIESYDAGNNRTLYRTRVYVCASGYNAYSGYSTGGNGYVDGQYFEFGGPGALSLTNACSEVYTGTFWVYGDANGWHGTVNASAYFNGGGGYAPGAIYASASAGGFDYDRKPDYPTSVSASRSGTSYTVYAGYANSPAGTPTYYVQYSENGGAWYNQNSMPGQQYTYNGLNKGSTYQFRVWATNSDGIGPFTYSGNYYVPTEPLAPASLTISEPSGRSVTVTAGTAPNGGATVTGYYVQYSTNNGSTWSSAVAMTNQQYTYTNLDGGLTYKFRVYAVNEMGNGATITSSGTFVPAYGKRWNGTDWVPIQTMKRWDGNAWVNVTIAKRWDGTAWVNLS